MRAFIFRVGRFVVVPALFFLSIPAFARPEYAVKLKMECTMCHVTPWGGGPRTVFGKVFGSRGLGSPKTNGSDLYFGDLRAIAFYPSVTSQRMNGTALMEAAASANVPILSEDNGSEMRAVATYNFAPLQSAAREAYVRFRPANSQNTYFTLGRIYMPFGLLTDEHRTYTQQQTNMTFTDFNTGAAFSTLLPGALHVDLAVVNDFQAAGTFNTTGVTWADVLNLRWMPDFMPLMFGASQNFEYTTQYPEPFAFALYTGLSLDRLTQDALNGSLLAEAVMGKNWDNSTMNPEVSFFVPSSDATYQGALNQSRSLGIYVQGKYDFDPRFSLVYKFDYLNLDTRFAGDAFVRHGLGFEYFFNSNLILDARAEKAWVGRPELKDSNTTLAAQSDLLAMLHLWL